MRERTREFILSKDYRKEDLHGYVANIRRLLKSSDLASESYIIDRRREILRGQTLRFSRDRIR